MANKRIKDLTEKNVLASGDYFPIDNSTDGTKKVNSSKILDPISHVQGEVSGSGDSYSSSNSYAKGNLVIHDNVLYVCTSACTAGSWATNSSHFTATTLASEVTSVKSDLSKISTSFKVVTHTTGSYSNLVQTGEVWLIVAQKFDTSESCILLVNRDTSYPHVFEVAKTANMTYDTNQFGSIAIKYNGSYEDVHGTAIRIYAPS